MQTYICKCGRTFEKSSKADTTGYVLKDYSPQHECYGCPYIVIERDWITHEIVKQECRATPHITYATRCDIGTDDKDYSMCHLYSLDLAFVRRVMRFVNTLDGAAKGENINCIPDEWRAADFGRCYVFKDCCGLAIFPLYFQKNVKGTEARRAVMEQFFTLDGRRRNLSETDEKEIVLQRIEIAKENARAEMYKSTASICSTCMNNGECVPKITDTCIAYEKAAEDMKEEKDMTAAFDLGAMLSTPSAATENQVRQIPCDMLVPYHNHKFELYSGERLADMVSSVKENGVLIPIIVQPLNGKYEILIGHNRWNASKLAGLPAVPAIIKNGLTEEEAEMYVIESNLMQRGFDNLKISEQAAVIAMRHNQMFSQGKRNDIIRELELLENLGTENTLTSSPVGKKSQTSSEKVGSEYGMCKNSVARLLRIDKLIDGIKPLVDDGTIPIRAAVNVSYLPEDIQVRLITLARKYKLDIKKSEQLREYEKQQGLDQLTVIKILMGRIGETPKQDKPKNIKISQSTYTKYFDKKAKPEEISEIVEKALGMYFSMNGKVHFIDLTAEKESAK